MSENSEHFARRVPPDFSEDLIRRFLLGQLSEAERPAFEERLFADDKLEARVHLAEFDLIDDYAFARLSAADRKLFEQRFLLTADRKQKLDVSTALRDRFASMPLAAASRTSMWNVIVREELRRLLRLNRSAWRFAFGAVLFVILFAAAWLVIIESRINRATNQSPPIVKGSPSPGSKRESQHNQNPSPPGHQEAPLPMPPHELPGSPAIMSLELSPSASQQGAGLSVVNLPKGERGILRLRLAFKADQTGSYLAELFTGEGRFVLRSESLKPNEGGARAEIDFEVPARRLATGDYQIKLRRVDDGSKGGVESYFFRVR